MPPLLELEIHTNYYETLYKHASDEFESYCVASVKQKKYI